VTKYFLDADVLIQAKNGAYGFDIVPGFWRWVETAHASGKVFVVRKVADEVEAGDDELAEWMSNQPPSFKITTDAGDAGSLAALSAWAAASTTYRQAAISTFLAAGDYYLIAQAHARGYTVVTHEVPAPQSKTRIKIPDACNALGVPWKSLFQMLRTEGARFA
jgi:Domain of unknown function (DUF4411)